MRILLIDTCGDGASIALAENSTLIGALSTPARTASAVLLDSVESLLQEAGWVLQQLQAVGVVSGPGSFTGVRVGLACAKGLCEALSIPLAAISRLQVLAAASGLREGFAALNAGRGELFVLDIASGKESLQTRDAFSVTACDSRIVVCEQQLLEALGGRNVELHEIDASGSLGLSLRKLSIEGEDLGTVDANYLRGEQQIYGSKNSVTDATRE